MPSPETSSAVMWLSSAGMGMLAPGKPVGNAAIVPSLVKVPCTISSISAFASGECMSYLVFFFSLMGDSLSPHPNGQMGVLPPPRGGQVHFEEAHRLGADGRSEEHTSE